MFDLLHLYGSSGVTGARCKSSSSSNPANLGERFHISQHCGGQRETYGWRRAALKPANGQPKLCGWFEPHSPLHTFSISGGKLGFLSVWSTIFWLYGVENRIQFLFNTSSLTNHQMPVTKKCWYQRTLTTAFPCFLPNIRGLDDSQNLSGFEKVHWNTRKVKSGVIIHCACAEAAECNFCLNSVTLSGPSGERASGPPVCTAT